MFMMKLLLPACLCGAALLLSLPVSAAGPLPEGAKITINVKMTAVAKTKGDITTSSIDRAYSATCVLAASAPMRGDIETGEADPGDVAAMERASKKLEAAVDDNDLEAFAQKVEAEVSACGEDEACAMAVMQKYMNDPRLLQAGEAAAAAKPDVDAAVAGAQDTNMQIFQPGQCTGTLKLNDSHFTDDPGGEGGADAYQETVTVKGEAKALPELAKAWIMVIYGDFAAGKSIYHIPMPLPGTIAATSSLKGKYETTVQFLPDGATWPGKFGPEPGFLKAGSRTFDIPGGKVAVEWTVKKGG
jgi:hypothetical protein